MLIKTEVITYVMKRRMFMVGLVAISGRNGIIVKIRRIQSHKSLVYSLIVLTLILLITQLDCGNYTAIILG